jgi:outer membrane protein assembly factor BamE (lipoprotein component of BamABCDE complex)
MLISAILVINLDSQRVQPVNPFSTNRSNSLALRRQIMKLVILLALLLPLGWLTGCMTASQHRSEVQDDSGDKLTVGVVQKEVNVGMSGAAVLEILGSPNIVSTDEERREVWVYDKIATDFVYSNSSGGLSALILGFPSDVLFGGSGGYNKNAGAASRSQRTLTIIIKFDHDSLVRDFAYHSSSF